MLHRTNSDNTHHPRERASQNFVHPEHARTAALEAYRRAYESTSPAMMLTRPAKEPRRSHRSQRSEGSHFEESRRGLRLSQSLTPSSARRTRSRRSYGILNGRSNSHSSPGKTPSESNPTPAIESKAVRGNDLPDTHSKAVRKAKSAHNILLRKSHDQSPRSSSNKVQDPEHFPNLPENPQNVTAITARPAVSRKLQKSDEEDRDNVSARSVAKSHRARTNPFKKRPPKPPHLSSGYAHNEASLPPFNFANDAEVLLLPTNHSREKSDSQSRSSQRNTSASLRNRLKGMFKKEKPEVTELPLQQVPAKQFHFQVSVPDDDCEDTCIERYRHRSSITSEADAVSIKSLVPPEVPQSRITSWNSSIAAGMTASTVSSKRLSSIRELPSQQTEPALDRSTIEDGRFDPPRRRRHATSEESQRLYTALCQQICAAQPVDSPGRGHAVPMIAVEPSEHTGQQIATRGTFSAHQQRLSQKHSRATIRAVTPELNSRSERPQANTEEANLHSTATQVNTADRHKNADSVGHRMVPPAYAKPSDDPFRLSAIPSSPPSAPPPAMLQPHSSHQRYSEEIVDGRSRETVSSPSIYGDRHGPISRSPSPIPVDTSVATIVGREVKRFDFGTAARHRKGPSTATLPRPSSEWRTWMSDQMTEIELGTEQGNFNLDFGLRNADSTTPHPQYDTRSLAASLARSQKIARRESSAQSSSINANSDLQTGKTRQKIANRVSSIGWASSRESSGSGPGRNSLRRLVSLVGGKNSKGLRHASSSTRLASQGSLPDVLAPEQDPQYLNFEANDHPSSVDQNPWSDIAIPPRTSRTYSSKTSLSLFPVSTQPPPSYEVAAEVALQNAPRTSLNATRARSSVDLRARVKHTKEGSGDTAINIRRKRVSTSSATQFEDMTLQKITEGPYADGSMSPERVQTAAATPRHGYSTPHGSDRTSQYQTPTTKASTWNKENATPRGSPTPVPKPALPEGTVTTIRPIRSMRVLQDRHSTRFDGGRQKSTSPGQRMADEFLRGERHGQCHSQRLRNMASSPVIADRPSDQ